MLEDFNQTVENGSMLSCDVCIVGAGAAGITLANRLKDSGKNVVLLEGGGLTPPNAEGMALYDGKVEGRSYPLMASRLRYFGGTTNHWGGWCRPLDDVDFMPRSHVAHSGWPINAETLTPYYQRAHDICQISAGDYDTQAVLQGHQSAALDWPTQSTNAAKHGFVNKLFRFSPPTRFGKAYQQALTQAKNVRTLLNANAVSLGQQNNRITDVTIKTLDGKKTAKVKAGKVVLAMGGIENARFLLNQKHAKYGSLGNHADWVGRCFMDHFGYFPGYLLSRANLKYQRFDVNNAPVMPVISMSKEALLERGWNNFCVTLSANKPDTIVSPKTMMNPGWGDSESPEYWRYHVTMICEPTPNPDSRIMLGDERDALGMRKIRMNWSIKPEDIHNAGKVMAHIGKHIGALGLGRLQYSKPVPQDNVDALQFSTASHHMGTTRMSQKPADGVVNADGRVHHMDNLYVAGSSLFPTVGFSNPTLTIVALAERLADHLSGSTKGAGA